MPKARQSLHIRIPPYSAPRNAWRQAINAAVVDAQQRRGVHYCETDRLEICLRVYLDDKSMFFHDVDNRLKDVLDALQGRAGGPKTHNRLPAIIPNDRQVWRVMVEKALAPKQSNGMGHLFIRKLNTRQCL
jgi:hypothetical protein